MSKRAVKRNTDSDTLAFAKAITKLTQKQQDFIHAVEDVKTLKAETFTNMQLELIAKRSELTNLKKEYDVLKKDLQIKLDQEIKEYAYDKAVDILTEAGDIAVNEEEFKELEERITTIEKEMEEKMVAELSSQKKASRQGLEIAIRTKNLEHKAEIAMLTARVEHMTKERETFESTVSSMKEEIAAQRELTKQVAQASKNSAINQTFGSRS